MAIDARFTISGDEANRQLLRDLLGEDEADRKIAAALGRKLVSILKKWFSSRPSNRRGWPTTNFWGEIRSATDLADIRPDGATVVVGGKTGAKFAFKVHGGTITPKQASALTIPISAISYGKSVSKLREQGLQIFRPQGKDILAAEINGEFTPLYVLKKSVTQKPDPNALPPESEVEEQLAQTLEATITRQLRKAGRL